MRSDWTKFEIGEILQDYFQMLTLEIKRMPFNKAEHRRALIQRLNQRSEGSVEFKHQNISAILLKYNLPYVVGYKPRGNYQALLEEMVLEFLLKRKELDPLFYGFAHDVALDSVGEVDYQQWLVEPPEPIIVEEPRAEYVARLKKPNYLAIEQRNQAIGQRGEALVFEYEKWRLIHSGYEKLAEQVEWISKEEGDGAGFDILSKEFSGKDRYIEVKATKLGELAPFYFSKNELGFSQKHATAFHLYRVFKIQQAPRLFIKSGSFDQICQFEPTHFVGRIRK